MASSSVVYEMPLTSATLEPAANAVAGNRLISIAQAITMPNKRVRNCFMVKRLLCQNFGIYWLSIFASSKLVVLRKYWKARKIENIY